MTVPFEEDKPLSPDPPPLESGKPPLEYGGDIWVKIMAWILGGGLAVLALVVIIGIIRLVVKLFFDV